MEEMALPAFPLDLQMGCVGKAGNLLQKGRTVEQAGFRNTQHSGLCMGRWQLEA